jgi:hypothetical protein
MGKDNEHEALQRVLGEKVYRVASEGMPITNESLAEVIRLLSDDDPDLSIKIALDMLMR